jgi:predicted dehydrogenase
MRDAALWQKGSRQTGEAVVSQRALRVGIIGADTKASWAKLSHIPAITGLPALKLAAVATRNEQSAREAAEAFDAERWFSDPFAMIRDDLIDIVTVAVKVPAHRALVLAALEAGKAVYCEAPLGRDTAEAEEMARAARSRHTAIGLQGRLNPSLRRARQLISSGKIGRPLSARVVAKTMGFGPEMASRIGLLNKGSSGANMLTITAGHTLDAVEALLGPIVDADARAEILWPTVILMDTGERSARETPDHAGILGKTQSGAVFTAEIAGAVAPTDIGFSFVVTGSEGWLGLGSHHPYGFQAGDLKLAANVAFDKPEEAAVGGGMMGAAINVAEVYAHLARDLMEGNYTTPGFDHALHNARLIEAVARAADQGMRQKLG